MNASTGLGANPGHVKVELCVSGVRLDDAARAHADVLQPGIADDAGQFIELVLPEDLWVHVAVDQSVAREDAVRQGAARHGAAGEAAVREGTASDSPFLLSGAGDRFTLHRNGGHMEVRVVPQPLFYQRSTSRGRPMWEVGRVYGGCIVINPASACAYNLRGGPCRFCRSGSGIATEDSFPISVQEVIEVVRAAFDEGAAEFVYFNPPYVGGEDAGVAFLAPYVSAIKKHFDTLVAVQIHPPKTNHWIDRTYAMGVDALSYSVEIHDPDVLARRCAGRVRHIGRERYYDALGYAATIFPNGTVWSDLILGLEPIESTHQGIDALVAIGVLPVLSVYRATPRNAALDGRAMRIESVAPVFAHLFHSVRQAKINMGWVRDLSFAMPPLEARFFAGDEARVSVALQQFYRSRLGTLTTRGLSRLRRRLRVRTVSDSFDSSRL